MNYDKLVKALRHCVSDEKGVTKCAGCPYYPDITGCMDRLHTDAAAAIEALQAELEKKRTADCFGCKCDKLEPSGRLQKRGKPVLLAASSMNGCEELPKRGEWKPFDLTYGRSIYSCSVCEQATEVPMCMEKPMYAYCPNCGAKMEVQEC